MESPTLNWSKIPKLRSFLVSSISKETSKDSILLKVNNLLKKLKSSPDIKQKVLDLILSLKIVNHLNLDDQEKYHVQNKNTLLCEVEKLVHKVMKISSKDQETFSNQFGKKHWFF